MSEYTKATAKNKAAAASLLKIAADKAAASKKTTAEVSAEAPARAAAEGWNQTPGPGPRR